MAINGINGSGFNPYATGVTRGSDVGGRQPTAPATQRPASDAATATPTSAQRSVADAIKSDAAARAAVIDSAHAPAGVDQDLWSILSREERSYFVKAGAMGPLTYGRSQPAAGVAQAPLMRGGRLDIKA